MVWPVAASTSGCFGMETVPAQPASASVATPNQSPFLHPLRIFQKVIRIILGCT
jgi:hypothetical protein